MHPLSVGGQIIFSRELPGYFLPCVLAFFFDIYNLWQFTLRMGLPVGIQTPLPAPPPAHIQAPVSLLIRNPKEHSGYGEKKVCRLTKGSG
jgi:hypothetical protein